MSGVKPPVWSAGSHLLPSPEPQTQTGITRMHRDSKLASPGGSPSPGLGWKWGYDQEPLNTWKYLGTTVETRAAQQKSLNSLARVVLDNKIAHHYLLGVCNHHPLPMG